MQVKQALEQRFPGIEVQGGAYPVAPAKAALGKAMMILQFTLIGFVVFGDQLFAALGMQAPGFYADIRDKKLVFGMGAWFLGNMVQSSLNSTGAFEIFFSGSKVFSKLVTEQMPILTDVFDSIQAIM